MAHHVSPGLYVHSRKQRLAYVTFCLYAACMQHQQAYTRKTLRMAGHKLITKFAGLDTQRIATGGHM